MPTTVIGTSSTKINLVKDGIESNTGSHLNTARLTIKATPTVAIKEINCESRCYRHHKDGLEKVPSDWIRASGERNFGLIVEDILLPVKY